MASHKGNPSQTQVDKILMLASVFSLVVIGLVMVYSASSASLSAAGKDPYSDVISQGIYVVIGIVAGVFVWQFVPYRRWEGVYTWILWAVCMLLLVLTFAMGTTVNGARRWLYLGPIGMQPSEFIKIALLLMAIKILYDYQRSRIDLKTLLVQAAVLIILPLAFLYKTQSDLGTTFVCLIGIFAVMWIGRVPAPILAGIAATGVVFLLVAVFGSGYRSDRLVYLDPWNDGQNGLGKGYNIIRSFYALAEGGLFGVGIGNSHEKYQYLFASDSDFIFAVLGEEMGLVGALVVIALFLLILFLGLRIATNASDNFGSMVAGGLTIMLISQAFLNIGCAIGVFPTTGKPLPFISSGGSSVVSSLLIIGLILSVQREGEESRIHAKRRDELRVVRAERSGERWR